MSDDYHDDDSHSGGLWDPDALHPPPAPRRPALHAVPPPEPDDEVASSATEPGPEEERLVRLEEFRPVLHDENQLTERAGRRSWRRIIVAAATFVALSAIAATGMGRLTGDDRDPAKPAALATAAPDLEQAALTRTVKSAASQSPSRSTRKHRSARRRTKSRDSSKTHRDTSAAPAPRQESTQSTTLVSQPGPAPTATTDVTTRASSSPAKAQRATTTCEFPPC